MISRARRRLAAVAVVAAAMVFALAMPSMAVAVPGDWDNPVLLGALPWSEDTSGTFVATVDGTETFYEYNYYLPVAKGQTVRLVLTTASENAMLMTADYSTPLMVGGDSVTPTQTVLTFMSPATGNYRVSLLGSAVESFTLSAATISTVPFSMGGFTVPGSKKRNKSFDVSVRVSPSYNGLYVPVKFEIQRKSGTFKKYSTVTGTLYGGSSAYTKFGKKLKIKKTGTYRIRAVFSDAAHVRQTTKWKTIKIKR
jgi:hypothetical protein